MDPRIRIVTTKLSILHLVRGTNKSMRLSILFILTISSLSSRITTQQLPRHATIRLDITVGEDAFSFSDTMIEETLLQQVRTINKHLKDWLGVHVQYAGFGKTNVKATPGQGLADYSKTLTFPVKGGRGNFYDSNKFRMFLVKGDFKERFTTSGLGNACKWDGHSAVVLTSDTSENTRNMERALLNDMGIVNSAVCSCENCILDPSSDSSVIPDCARQVLKKNLKAYELWCLTMDPQVAWTRKSVCGNGLVEGGEQCDCWVSDTACWACCDKISCTKDASCKANLKPIDTPTPKPVVPAPAPVAPLQPKPALPAPVPVTPPQLKPTAPRPVPESPPPVPVAPAPKPVPPIKKADPPSAPVTNDGGEEHTRSTQSTVALPQSTRARVAPNNKGSSKSGSLKWYIIGGSGAVVLVLLMLFAIIAVMLIRKNRSRSAAKRASKSRRGSSKHRGIPSKVAKSELRAKSSKLATPSSARSERSGLHYGKGGMTEFFG